MSSRSDKLLALTAAAVIASAVAATVGAQEINASGYRQQTGEELYTGICQGCHMPDAKGASGAGAYPALANDSRLAARLYPLVVILNGQRAMPPIGEDLSDEQVANVINYVRTHFGNHYKDSLTPAAVKAARR